MDKQEIQDDIRQLEAKIEEMKKKLEEPRTHYPLPVKEAWYVNQNGCVNRLNRYEICKDHCWNIKNTFPSPERAERSNLCKLLNSEYDYWFPGFSEKPDFEPKGLQIFSESYCEWISARSVHVENFRKSMYRWKRTEN